MKDWLNADINGHPGNVLIMDASKAFPFPDASFEYVFSEHMFEHLDLLGQQNMMKESFRILHSGGILRLATPNFNFLMDLVQNPRKEINNRYLVWSYEKFISKKYNTGVDRDLFSVYVVNNFMRDWGHSFIHTPDSLIEMGRRYGFVNIKICSIGQSEHAALIGCEMHQYEIPDWANELETMVLEFQKP